MRAILATLLVLLLAVTTSAEAATVIYYSKDNAYGWCAGYSSSRGEECARGECESHGNDCFLALECPGGWGSTAFAEDDAVGFGASCATVSAVQARWSALLACIDASHALCWTNDTFSSSGRQTSADDDNETDLVFYAQSALEMLGYDIGKVDGISGRQTRDAVSALQAKLGIEQSGTVDRSLLDLMFYGVAGRQHVIDNAVTHYQEDIADPDRLFGYGKASAATTLTAELQDQADDVRRRALAAVMTLNGVKCSVPAESAVIAVAATQLWDVQCAEGSFRVQFNGYAMTVTPGPAPSSSEEPPSSAEPPSSEEPPGPSQQPHLDIN